MTLEQFNKLKVGSLVWVALNSGRTGVSQYQYVGVFKCHETNEERHVFLSPYFLSTVLLIKGNEQGSIQFKNIFLTKDEAKERATFLY